MARGSSKAAVTAKKKKLPPAAPKEISETKEPPGAPLDIQQKCLNIFRDALRSGDEDTKVLQEVKGHLFNRHFAQAFGKEEYLRVYASRWSPSRALGYLQVLTDIRNEILKERSLEVPEPLKISCIGGGAGAELVAIAAWLHQETSKFALGSVNSTFLDIAAWDSVVASLYEASTSPPHLSKYASAAAKEAKVALVPVDAYKSSFQQIDALEIGDEQNQELFSDSDLVTLMFTLNELYSTSMPKTQQMLARITATLRPGALLLVIDSPGSYSTVSINGAEKKYPMQWLLDFTLLGSGRKRSESSPAKWEKLASDDSRWFRLPSGLQYPIELENMRYQIHLYRRLPDAG